MSERNTPGFWVSNISDVTPEDVIIRGYPLQSIMGKMSFPAVVALLIRGRLPSPAEARMMDVILCSILDYSLQKAGTIAARCVASANPQMLPGLAAGVLAAGDYAVSPENTGRFITEGFKSWQSSGESLDGFAKRFVDDLRKQKKRIPGFGHPVFRVMDPRAKILKDCAVDLKLWGPYGDWYEAVHGAFKAAVNKPDLVINDVGMLACILAEMGYSPQEMAGLAILSTFPGLIAHVSEEIREGAPLRVVPDSIARYSKERRELAVDLVAAGWS
jgi:citrate synthase